jgi:cytochrome c553
VKDTTAMHATHSSFSAPLTVVLAALAALAAAACAPAAPANPSWEQDVKPILAANCVRCHRNPPVNGAPAMFRFDECEDDSATLQGAATKAGTILARVTLGRDIPTTMPPPPAAELSDRQIEILENWQANGAPCTGAAAAPSFVLLRATEESLQPGAAPGEQQLAIRYTLEDPARRLVSATVVAVSASGETHVAPEPLRAGTGELVWSLDAMAPGTYDVLVTLDDGSEIREVRTGTFAIGR